MKMISSYIMCVYIIYMLESIRSTSKCIMYGGALLLENSSILIILASTTIIGLRILLYLRILLLAYDIATC